MVPIPEPGLQQEAAQCLLCRCTGYQNIFRAVKKTMHRRLGKNEEAELVR